MVANGAVATHTSPMVNRDVGALNKTLCFVLLKCIFLHLLADLFCSKGSGGETTFSATCSTRSLFSTQLSAIQQEADWLQVAEIIQNHLKERIGNGKSQPFSCLASSV